MKKIPASRSNLLLMDMIISVLLFSFASAVCLQIFVKASLLSKDTAELDAVVRYASSAAEILSQPEHTIEHFKTFYPEASVEEQEAYLWFDEVFNICTREEAAYEMQAASSPKDGHTTIWSVIIRRSNSLEELYRLEGTAYRQHTLLEDQ